MKKAILTTKVGMTQIFNEDGVLVPVTVLQAGPCVVTQVKTVENDGYSAVQVGLVYIEFMGIARLFFKKLYFFQNNFFLLFCTALSLYFCEFLLI